MVSGHFRLQRATEMGYYPLLREMYGNMEGLNYSDIDLNRYNASDVSMERLLLDTAHSKDSMILQYI